MYKRQYTKTIFFHFLLFTDSFETNYGNVFEIGIEGVWANLTKEHQLIYDQEFSENKLKLICNNCDRAGIKFADQKKPFQGWNIGKTINRQNKYKNRYFKHKIIQ